MVPYPRVPLIFLSTRRTPGTQKQREKQQQNQIHPNIRKNNKVVLKIFSTKNSTKPESASMPQSTASPLTVKIHCERPVMPEPTTQPTKPIGASHAPSLKPVAHMPPPCQADPRARRTPAHCFLSQRGQSPNLRLDTDHNRK